MDEGRAVINPVVYAEVSVGYDTIEDLDEALLSADYEREPLPYEAVFLAGSSGISSSEAGLGRKRPG